MIRKVEVLAADQAADDLQILEEVAEQVFAQKQRTPGWFQRKLLRERVDARLSVVARTNDLRNNSCAGVCGYLLLGLPHEASQIAYGAGMGVLPQFRGFGVGRLLVEQAKKQLIAAESAGSNKIDSMELLATKGVQPFYQRLGFTESEARATLFAAARGDTRQSYGVDFHSPLSWDFDAQVPVDSYLQVGGWHAHIWSATPIHQKFTLSIHVAQDLAPSWAHISREGNALLVQRLLIPRVHSVDRQSQILLASVDRFLAIFPSEQPCFLYGCRTSDFLTQTLVEHEWQAIQEFSTMRWSSINRCLFLA